MDSQRPEMFYHQFAQRPISGSSWRKPPKAPRGLSAFIVEKNHPGAKTGRIEHKIGLRGSNTGELVFDNCQIPKKNILGQEGGGLAVALKTVSESGRPGMAATALGYYQCMPRRSRENLPVNGCFMENPSVPFRLSVFIWRRSIRKLDICRLLCYRASWMKDQNMRCDNEIAMGQILHLRCRGALRT